MSIWDQIRLAFIVMGTAIATAIVFILFVSEAKADEPTIREQFICDQIIDGNVNDSAKETLIDAPSLRVYLVDRSILAVSLNSSVVPYRSIRCAGEKICSYPVASNAGGNGGMKISFENQRYVKATQRTTNIDIPALATSAKNEVLFDKVKMQYRNRHTVNILGLPVLYYDFTRQCHLEHLQ